MTKAEEMAAEQMARLQKRLDEGWRLETEWQKIDARYKDIDMAETVPREIMYVDIGALVGRIQALETIIRTLGAKIPEGPILLR